MSRIFKFQYSFYSSMFNVTQNSSISPASRFKSVWRSTQHVCFSKVSLLATLGTLTIFHVTTSENINFLHHHYTLFFTNVNPYNKNTLKRVFLLSMWATGTIWSIAEFILPKKMFSLQPLRLLLPSQPNLRQWSSAFLYFYHKRTI